VRPDRRALAFLLAAAAGIGAVAVAADGSLLRGDGEAHRLHFGSGLQTVAVALAVAWILAALVIFVAVVTSGGRRSATFARRRSWTMLVATLLALVVLSFVDFSRPKPGQERESQPQDSAGETAGERREPSPSWPLAVAGLLVVGAVAVAVAGRRERPARRTREDPGPGDRVAAARELFDASLDDLRAEPDPRTAITKAYQRLLDGLDRLGMGRRPAEAPVEHLERALRGLQVPPAPLRALVELFAEAAFSEHVLGPSHKEAAISAFESARDELNALVRS